MLSFSLFFTEKDKKNACQPTDGSHKYRIRCLSCCATRLFSSQAARAKKASGSKAATDHRTYTSDHSLASSDGFHIALLTRGL